MITKLDRLLNQLISTVYIDKNDPSIIRIQFDRALQIFYNADIIVPPKAFENTFKKVVEERLVAKIRANDVAKFAIAQAMMNTAFSLMLSKEELIKLRMQDNSSDITSIRKK